MHRKRCCWWYYSVFLTAIVSWWTAPQAWQALLLIQHSCIQLVLFSAFVQFFLKFAHSLADKICFMFKFFKLTIYDKIILCFQTNGVYNKDNKRRMKLYPSL